MAPINFTVPYNQSDFENFIKSPRRVDIFEDLDSFESIKIKISLLALTLISQLLVVALTSAIVFFEKFGGDSQKRTIRNQLTTQFAPFTIIQMLLPANVVNARFLSYPKPNWVAKCFHFIPLSNIGFAAAFIVKEMTIIRYLSVFRWKTVVPKINDNFFAIFFGLCNFVISLLSPVHLRKYGA